LRIDDTSDQQPRTRDVAEIDAGAQLDAVVVRRNSSVALGHRLLDVVVSRQISPSGLVILVQPTVAPKSRRVAARSGLLWGRPNIRVTSRHLEINLLK
jgi:hypothetical protein